MSILIFGTQFQKAFGGFKEDFNLPAHHRIFRMSYYAFHPASACLHHGFEKHLKPSCVYRLEADTSLLRLVWLAELNMAKSIGIKLKQSANIACIYLSLIIAVLS